MPRKRNIETSGLETWQQVIGGYKGMEKHMARGQPNPLYPSRGLVKHPDEGTRGPKPRKRKR